MLDDELVSPEPLALPDALVSTGAPAAALDCDRIDLICCIASSLRCLRLRSCSILCSLLALSCELSGGAKPGGMVAEGGTFEEASFLRARNWASAGISAARAIVLSFSANAFSRSSNAFSRVSSSIFRWASCCSAAASCFWQEQTIAKGMSIERAKSFFISEVVF